ncbi:Fanconi anemia group C protein isoform X1 [Synchiropus splendidus]|uniref:Fanconi anemia group C protein isoform X1 n=1 Tax=Synchiropus splendidus TaxID=270530 RepID=UPI00237E06F9|nr:Fanconi anemia group C protein isoform X1 [Synchiropus splendidus]XP_053725544.1 Fanconi anemia group C protein isoform X1 [Synchiropus splendidus]XP_053725545.1 Fanconi anemia group C protein isoform X1 [Synchiropus splendidus]XP_053725546.1 Fanconi anemia group C protein isoform X1 [Synchiropus splendidus]XP_053725548.1 Fanconi anemia group C protein isoform X1 [Synchiropus splendidus]XP_053725549.1 Fanconi anemia group C protein isoform X1 [Synchiropus splendidus]XP_053725550.1 Fanconi 
MSQPPQSEVQELHIWLERTVNWSRSDSRDALRDTCRFLNPLRDFLQQLLVQINSTSSTAEITTRLPVLGQLLGQLCQNHLVIANDTCRKLVFNCLWGLYSDNPSNPLETETNLWIRKVLSQLVMEEEDVEQRTLVTRMNVSPLHYHHKVHKKMVAQLLEVIEKRCSSYDGAQRCSCESSLAVSEACVPLVSFPETAPLIGALLKRPLTCANAGLSEDFLKAVSAAYLSHSVSLDEQALISLWRQWLPSLEDAALSLLESALTHSEPTPQKLEQQVLQSVLPQACARHCSIFLVVNDILRSILMKREENGRVRRFIQTFTCCFLRELTVLQPQMSVSLKAFFPQAPPNLLLPLLTLPSEVPQEAWRLHLNWLSGSLRSLTEQEEEADGDSGSRGHRTIFEVWFLLVQCAGWVQVATQLLVTCEAEHSGGLLWLLTFYHHPTNRGHCRTEQLVHAAEAWERSRLLLSFSACPPSGQQLQYFVARLSPHSQQPALSPVLILDLLVNTAVFSQPSGSTDNFKMVVERCGLVSEAARALESLEQRFTGRSSLSCDANGAHLRIKALQKALPQSHAAM